MSTRRENAAMHAFQEQAHGADHDYENGSPHLQHASLREWIVATVLGSVSSATPVGRRPRVLEIGAGHGTLTSRLVAAGADVVVTEMSGPSADELRRRFDGVEAVTVVHDPDGSLAIDGDVDAVVYISVLHHIPDYVAAVGEAARRLRPGGALISFQDPLWYPRRRRIDHLSSQGIYYAWRLTQGEVFGGLGRKLRRLRGVYDESQAPDMVEYHVVRRGVDEEALMAALRPGFGRVDLLPYWSTQSAWGQRLGTRLLRPNTFGLVAHDRLAAPGGE